MNKLSNYNLMSLFLGSGTGTIIAVCVATAKHTCSSRHPGISYFLDQCMALSKQFVADRRFCVAQVARRRPQLNRSVVTLVRRVEEE